jgi:hypothetical protein
VTISPNVEWPGGHEQDTVEIPYNEWDTMTPAQRRADLDDRAAEHATNQRRLGLAHLRLH